MTIQQLKQKLAQYLEDFKTENNAFQKVAIVKDYVLFIEKYPDIKNFFEDTKKRVAGLYFGMIEGRDKITGKKVEHPNIKKFNIPVFKRDKDTPIKDILEAVGFLKNTEGGIADNLLNEDEQIKFHYFALCNLATQIYLYKIVGEDDRKKLEDNLKKNLAKTNYIDATASNMRSLSEWVIDRISKREVLNELDKNNEAEQQKTQISFNPENSTLNFKGEEIKITRKNDFPIDHYILDYLFEQEDLNEENYYKEIAKGKIADFDYHGDTDWNKYYKACQRLQDKIRTSTKAKIDDFLIFNSGKTAYVKINPKYAKSCLKNEPLNPDE